MRFLFQFVKIQYHFRKGFSTQHALLVMKEKILTVRCNKKFCSTSITDLLKPFNCVCQNLLIAELIAFDSNAQSLTMITLVVDHKKMK